MIYCTIFIRNPAIFEATSIFDCSSLKLNIFFALLSINAASLMDLSYFHYYFGVPLPLSFTFDPAICDFVR